MRFDREMDSKLDSKHLRDFLLPKDTLTVHFAVHPMAFSNITRLDSGQVSARSGISGCRSLPQSFPPHPNFLNNRRSTPIALINCTGAHSQRGKDREIGAHLPVSPNRSVSTIADADGVRRRPDNLPPPWGPRRDPLATESGSGKRGTVRRFAGTS